MGWVPVLAVAVVTALPAGADAHYLSKTRAKAKTMQIARAMCARSARCEAWGVEKARTCARKSPHSVECDFALWRTDEVVCYDAARVRFAAPRSTRLQVWFPYEPFCRDEGEEEDEGSDDEV